MIFSSFILHITAMILMLCDHLWATVLIGYDILTCLGRIAFPIFAFMVAEGFYNTKDIKKYILRMFVFAVISEVPFNLMYGSSVIYPYHQNVLWVFLIALLAMTAIEKAKKREKLWQTIIISALICLVSFVAGYAMMADYYGAGVLLTLGFYFFHGRKWWCIVGQAVVMCYVNLVLMGGVFYPITIAGHEFELQQQAFALLALIPIWMYSGKQGYHKKWFQYLCYAFYPVHMLILYAIWQLVI